MAVTWPSTLPKSPLRSGYSYQDGDGRVATEMQQGPPRFRRLYTNVPRSYSVQFAMTLAQVAAFETFYETTLAGGSIAVDLPVKNSAGNVTASVYIAKKSAVQIDESDEFIIGLQVITA